jgi:2-polyprenyl-3-methyl-5-hydroxy-6-metoxy-1,4-benzoquinol methylase
MTGAEEDRKHWFRVAGECKTWAREPNHDEFWAYQASLAAFIGGGRGEALDVGCGEGRVSRELMALGFQVNRTSHHRAEIQRTNDEAQTHPSLVAAARGL